MKLEDYKLTNWNEGKFKRKKGFENFTVLLLSTKGVPPREGEKNLLAVNKANEIIWIADLPTEVYDSYIEMKYINGIIRAESSNSFVSEINPDTGIIMNMYMVK